jgi:hypothetical protein
MMYFFKVNVITSKIVPGTEIKSHVIDDCDTTNKIADPHTGNAFI